jgi:hypothetical protein
MNPLFYEKIEKQMLLSCANGSMLGVEQLMHEACVMNGFNELCLQ